MLSCPVLALQSGLTSLSHWSRSIPDLVHTSETILVFLLPKPGFSVSCKAESETEMEHLRSACCPVPVCSARPVYGHFCPSCPSGGWKNRVWQVDSCLCLLAAFTLSCICRPLFCTSRYCKASCVPACSCLELHQMLLQLAADQTGPGHRAYMLHAPSSVPARPPRASFSGSQGPRDSGTHEPVDVREF